jgi:hypothetical protein
VTLETSVDEKVNRYELPIAPEMTRFELKLATPLDKTAAVVPVRVPPTDTPRFTVDVELVVTMFPKSSVRAT